MASNLKVIPDSVDGNCKVMSEYVPPSPPTTPMAMPMALATPLRAVPPPIQPPPSSSKKAKKSSQPKSFAPGPSPITVTTTTFAGSPVLAPPLTDEQWHEAANYWLKRWPDKVSADMLDEPKVCPDRVHIACPHSLDELPHSPEGYPLSICSRLLSHDRTQVYTSWCIMNNINFKEAERKWPGKTYVKSTFQDKKAKMLVMDAMSEFDADPTR